MKKEWFPTVITVLLGILTASTPYLQGLIKDHPELAAAIVTAYTVLKGLLPSPLIGDK